MQTPPPNAAATAAMPSPRTRIIILHGLLLLLSVPNPATCTEEYDPVLSDDNIHQAVNLWLDNPAAATDIWGSITNWDTKRITNMDDLFKGATLFDADLSDWNTARVTSMKYTFAGCTYFSSPLNSWNVEQVTAMTGMFTGASTFDQDLQEWNTTSLLDVSAMFKGATHFNGSLAGWDTSRVTDMEFAFYSATFFSGHSIADWDVSATTTMHAMFSGATQFSANVAQWNPQSVQSFVGMFAYTAAFTGNAEDGQDLSLWNVGSAEFMDRMFYRAEAFEGELCWDDSLPSGVTGMEMFCGSSGTFTMSCNNQPYGSEMCDESWQEIEEEEEMRESPTTTTTTTTTTSSSSSNQEPMRGGYGGAGGVGAMNPGAVGRDIPEITATIHHEFPSTDQEEGNVEFVLDEEFGFENDADGTSAAAAEAQQESSAAFRRAGPALVSVTVTAALSLMCLIPLGSV